MFTTHHSSSTATTAFISNDFFTLICTGVDVEEGDVIVAIDGVRTQKLISLDEMLLGKIFVQVELVVLKFKWHKMNGKSTRVQSGSINVKTKTLASDREIRHRDWVNHNRDHVHAMSNGKVGYIYVPNMVSVGWSEFNRQYLLEV
jgi:tricorn protease